MAIVGILIVQGLGPSGALDSSARTGSWVHAYLHRKERDQGNAAYWYSRAGKPVCREPLDAEWLSIVTALIKAT